MPEPRLDPALAAVIERSRNDAKAGFECARTGGAWRLRIWGWFPPDWCGNLSLHCYAARLSVLEGDACRVRASLWAGTFLLAKSGNGESPRALDFVHMARHRPSAIGHPAPVQIDRLRVARDPEGGAATVEIAGPDRIGFLACVLDELAFCGLYPHRLAVRTTADRRAEDWFSVLGVGGTPPTERALAALESLLTPESAPDEPR